MTGFIKRLWRALKEEGGAYAHPAVAYLLAAWVTHGLLRAAILFRRDAFGSPFVGKPDWYIFHALAIDQLWILKYSLPVLLVMVACGAAGMRRTGRACLIFLIAAHSVVLLFTVADDETMRFMGMHLDPSFLSTYVNPAASREVLKFVASDRSVPYLPYVLFLGCVPLSLLLFRLFSRRFTWLGRKRLGWAVPSVLLGASLISYVFLNHVWPGNFRMRKLKPFPVTVVESLTKSHGKSGPRPDVFRLGQVFQRQWLLEQGDSSWVFPDTTCPYFKKTLYEFCGDANDRNRGGLAGRCEKDRDGDGFPATRDCDDADAKAHPGAVDTPGNGVDEDCDGVDLKPANIVLIIMESHRAVNVGHLRPYGATGAATPFLDSLAKQGQFWTRFSVTGVPTINALMAIHASLLQHPNRYIATDFTALRQRAFSTVLGDHGYLTHFFSAADPAWDGQTPWLRQWYQGISYDRDRETDAAMFAHMARWMKGNLRAGEPFLMTAMTKTNHYPFNPVEGVKPTPAETGLPGKMLATMEYTDDCLRRFMDAARMEPWFENTVFVFLGDHGFPLSEHGSSNIGYGLYTESVWIPFVIFGNHPKLNGEKIHGYPAGQIDIGPTLLDLAGIREGNHYLGHSLLRPASGMNSTSYVLWGEQGSLERGEFRLHGASGDIPREQDKEIFNTLSDKAEKRNLYAPGMTLYDSLMPFVRDMRALNTYLVETNALMPETAPTPGGSTSKTPR